MAQRRVIFWRGSRDAYNTIKNAGKLDYWTRYSVKDSDGQWTEYYGDNLVNVPTGNLFPVIDILEVTEYEAIEHQPGDRYLVGNDDMGYTIMVTKVKDGENLDKETIKFATPGEVSDYSVRVKNKGMKSYVYVDNMLRTYDDINAGIF